MSQAPRAVVFDVGHVLVDWDPRYLYEKLIPEGVRLDDFLARVVTRAWHYQHDAGRAFAETSAELIARHPEHRALIEAYGPRFAETIPARIAGMTALVEALAARRVPLFAITNFSAEFWPPIRAREAELFDRFTAIVVSGEEKLVKPDPAIFTLALARFGLAEGEGLFVDDRAENVVAARASGFLGHVFTGAAPLRAVLEGYGLL
ncbi:MAG TPA: HAD family phosphatase [Sphingomonadaceae bacterium]|nr:HAD family phosphatase [Sphingomonadaceae bacterium]